MEPIITYTAAVAARYRRTPLSGATKSGYGSRIPVDCEVRLEGEPEHRWYRVYAICYSNAASFYVRSRGCRLFLRDAELDALRYGWAVGAPEAAGSEGLA